jgi:hypothetical protein
MIAIPPVVTAGSPGTDLGFHRLKSPELEDRFRTSRLQRDRAQMIVVAWVTAAAVVVFALADVMNTPSERSPLWIEAVRAVVFVSTIAFVFFLRRPITVRQYDMAVVGWMIMFAAELLMVNAVRPDAHALNAMLDIMAIIAVYVVIPVPLAFQAIPTALATFGYLALWGFTGPPPDGAHAVVIVACFLLAHAFGSMGSRHTHRLSREQFLAFRREQDARGALQKAMEEIKALQGIVPICAHCRKVRSDDGFWEQAEAYFTKRTGADLSHGICPECISRHFPDVDVTGLT